MGSSHAWLPWAVYTPIGALGMAWAFIAHGTVLSAKAPGWLGSTRAQSLSWGVLLALCLTAATVLATRWLVVHTRWARALHVSLRGVLLGAGFGRIAVLAGLSAVAEELLFRAALQPSIGLGPAALLFGIVHVSPRGTGLSWPVWAAVMGLLLGLLYEASGHLLPPIIAHALINYENMQYICSYDPTPLDMERLRAHQRN